MKIFGRGRTMLVLGGLCCGLNILVGVCLVGPPRNFGVGRVTGVDIHWGVVLIRRV